VLVQQHKFSHPGVHLLPVPKHHSAQVGDPTSPGSKKNILEILCLFGGLANVAQQQNWD
jgi:hypothetical protein